MNAVLVVARREVAAFAATPAAYVAAAAFLALANALTFEVGGLFDAGVADLSAFFRFHPWLYLVFLSALSMRLWAEEIASGTLEPLLASPAPTWALALGKFLAAWLVAGAILALTFPLWATVNVLGDPDNGAIAAGYWLSLLAAGGYLAIGSAASAASGSAVIGFSLSAAVGFLFTAAGLPLTLAAVRALAGPGASDLVAAFSILDYFDAAGRGVIEARGVAFFLALIAAGLTLTTLFIDARRGRL